MLNFAKTGNETFDTTFTKAYNLIINKYPNSTANVNSALYFDRNIKRTQYNCNLLTLNETEKILNAMLDGRAVNSSIDTIMIDFISFLVNSEYAWDFKDKIRPYEDNYELTHSLINNICKLLSHGVAWPFDTDNYHHDGLLHPIILNHLLNKHAADDDWWINVPVVKNNTIADAEYVSDCLCIKAYNGYITTHDKLSQDTPNILNNIFNDNLLIPTSMIKIIINQYCDRLTDDVMQEKLALIIIKRLQSIASTGASLNNLDNLDSKTIESNAYNVNMLIHNYLHNMKYHNDYDVLMVLLSDVIIDNKYDDMIVILLSKLIIEIKSAYNELYNDYYRIKLRNITSLYPAIINNTIYHRIDFHKIISSYPEIVQDSAYYPTEFVKEMIKTAIIDDNNDNNATSQESN